MAARVAALAAQNKVPEAIEAGERFLGKHPDPQGDVHSTLARLYTEQGDPVSAVRHLSQGHPGTGAMTVTSSSAVSAAAQPAVPAPVVAPAPGALVPAAPAAPVAPAAPAAPTDPAARADDASVRITPGGIEVRAGDASVQIRK